MRTWVMSTVAGGVAILGVSLFARTSFPLTHTAATSSWLPDTSASQVPPRFGGHSFTTLFDDLLRRSAPKSEFESTDEHRARLAKNPIPASWFLLRIQDNLSVDYDADSQVVVCKIELASARSERDMPSLQALLLGTQRRVGSSYTGQNAFGVRTQVSRVTREVSGIALVTQTGDPDHIVSEGDLSFAFPLNRAAAATVKPRLRVFAVCRVIPSTPDGETVFMDSEEIAPTIDSPFQITIHYRFLTAHVSSLWFVDSASGVILSKQPFDPLESLDSQQ